MVLIPLLLLGIGVALWHRRRRLISRLCAVCLCVLLTSQGCSRKGADPVARPEPAGQKDKQNVRGEGGQERTKEAFRDVAGRMVKAINAADYEGIRKDFSKEMLEAFPVAKCRAFFSKEISGKFGKINKLEPAQFKSGAEAVFAARCERGTLDFTLVLDDEGRVAGMLFRPGSDAAPPIDDILKKINASQDDELFGQCTTEFQKAIPIGDFRAVMQQVRKQFGKLNEWTEQKPAGDAKVYRVQAEKGACIVKITLDNQGRIAGLEITPDMSSKKKEQSDGPSYAGVPRSDGPSGAWLAGLITDLRKEKKLVGLAARVMVDGQVVACAADGERKRGSGVSIELGDRWHLGSITKSITATMIARLIESGQMQWTDTVGERFPDAPMHDHWKPVTLQQLLTHTSGAPANFSLWLNLKEPALGPECTKERRKAVMDAIAEKPAYPPGEKYAYSNVGYTIAAAMAETATGVSWEDLVKREVFKPLELSDVGFGPPKSSSQTLDQPLGHRGIFGWKTSASDEEDNNPIIGPAGAVHMTLGNLGKYATEHLRGELGAGKLLTAETFKRLHTPKLHDYACGWVVKQPNSEIPHTVYWHNGSNTMWYALVAFIPGKNMAVAVTSNDGDIKQAESAAWKVVKASANQFNIEGDAARRKSLQPGD